MEMQSRLAMFDSVIASGQAALKSALLINGGAAVALLAFIGNIWTKGTSQAAVDSLTYSIACFAFGVLCAAVATGATYLTQLGYSSKKWSSSTVVIHFATVILIILSYVLFAIGVYQAYFAFLVHLTG